MRVKALRLSLVSALAICVPGCGGTSPGSSSATPPAAATPAAARTGYDGELPPLPVVQFASARPAPVTRAAYEFAARHPDVLKYVPCFCGCERNGHGNNEDCFVTRRKADGSPEWNPHGIGCGICIDVAVAARQMHSSGATVADIRRAIDQKYKSEFPTSTPTPHPH
jgi:Protein of unknown function with PCYCGC motif